MRISLDKSDRRLLLWTGLILLPVIVLLALASPEERDSGVPSTYSSQAHGALAAYLLLKEEGYRVERWERSPQELPAEAHGTVLVLAAPWGSPDQEEKNALHAYLARGGKILATGFAASFFLPRANIVSEPLPGAVWKEYQPEILSPLTRAGAIKMSPAAYWDAVLLQELVHYSHEGKGIVVSYKQGQGEIVWWAADTPLTNAGIRESGNLDLLLNSLGGSKDVRILWDEFFHGSRPSVEDYLAVPPLQYGLAQCLLVFLAVLLTHARRNAPIRPWSEPSRLSPLEFVQTLGGLYRQAQSTRAALEVPYYRFRHLLTKRLGLRARTDSGDLAAAVQRRMGYREPGLEDTLRQVESALLDPEVSEARALELAQRLSLYARHLQLTSQGEQENTTHADRRQGIGPRAN